MAAEIEERFAEGVRLFNNGDFFAAHEVLEQAWKVAEGEEKIFYQGIIQAAAALVHVRRGNYPGAISVYLKSHPKLCRFPALWMGIDLGQFRSDLMRYFAAVQTALGITQKNCQLTRPEQIPDTEHVPTIRWAP